MALTNKQHLDKTLMNMRWMLCLYTIHIHILYTIHKNITKYLLSICDKFQDINLLIVKIFIQLYRYI